MEKDRIIEGNQMIAIFMGYTYFPHTENKNQPNGWKKADVPLIQKMMYSGEIGKRSYLCRSHNELSFHNSWEWIMPVIEKISSLQGWNYSYSCGEFVIYDDNHKHFADGKRFFCAKTNWKHSMWQVVVDFLNYHSRQNG